MSIKEFKTGTWVRSKISTYGGLHGNNLIKGGVYQVVRELPDRVTVRIAGIGERVIYNRAFELPSIEEIEASKAAAMGISEKSNAQKDKTKPQFKNSFAVKVTEEQFNEIVPLLEKLGHEKAE